MCESRPYGRKKQVKAGRRRWWWWWCLDIVHCPTILQVTSGNAWLSLIHFSLTSTWKIWKILLLPEPGKNAFQHCPDIWWSCHILSLYLSCSISECLQFRYRILTRNSARAYIFVFQCPSLESWSAWRNCSCRSWSSTQTSCELLWLILRSTPPRWHRSIARERRTIS